MKLLVTSLGDSIYKACEYHIEGAKYQCNMPSIALRQHFKPDRILVLCTDVAWDVHKAHVEEHLPEAVRWRIDDGNDADGQTGVFASYLKALTHEDPDEVLLDITFGFRAQPFVASTAVGMAIFTAVKPPVVRILYGGALPKAVPGAVPTQDPPKVDIWELTDGVLDAVQWARGLDGLLNSGTIPSALLDIITVRGKAHRKQKHAEAEPLDKFATAVRTYVNDLACINVPALVGPKGSANGVRMLIPNLNTTLGQLPALASVLGRLNDQLSALTVVELGEYPESDQMLAALAKHYLNLGRYPEAITVVREAWVSRFAATERARAPGAVQGDEEQRMTERESSNKIFYNQHKHVYQVVAQVRNAVNHGGYQFGSGWMPSATLRVKVEELVATLAATTGSFTDSKLPENT